MQCQYFALCENEAAGKVAHVAFADGVPTCQRCAERFGLSFIPTPHQIEHGPDCKPEDMTEPDWEGVSDCVKCGLWEQREYAATQVGAQLSEQDEILDPEEEREIEGMSLKEQFDHFYPEGFGEPS